MIRETLRQWMYPRELRIGDPAEELSATLIRLIRLLDAPRLPATREEQESGRANRMDARTLAQIGTHLWRLKSKLIDPGSSTPRPEFTRAYRHFDAAWDALADAGIEIIDPTGRAFDEGQALKALAFQPVPGLRRNTVIQTLKPSILVRGALIQPGEVIIGTPETDTNER